jgi:hypothetical protein
MTSKWLVGLQGQGGDDNKVVNPRGSSNNDTTISLVMAKATRVVGNKEGDGGKSNGEDKRGVWMRGGRRNNGVPWY